jgi:hypothetical protein
MPAQDRIRRGPFAALLILLSLVLGSAGAAATGNDVRGHAARPASSRHAAAALLPSATRNTLDDEAPREGVGSLPPSAPGIVTETLWARPLAEAPAAAWDEVPEPASASYRARAPPAS